MTTKTRAQSEKNPRRRRRRRRNPRRKNMKGSTVALIAVGVLVGVPLLIVGATTLAGVRMVRSDAVVVPTATAYAAPVAYPTPVYVQRPGPSVVVRGRGH